MAWTINPVAGDTGLAYGRCVREPSDTDLAAVIRLELELHEPSVRSDAGRLGELLDPDFVEFGASGRRWDRASIMESLLAEPVSENGDTIEATDVAAQRLADDVVLVTYTTQTPERRALRSSIWRRVDGRWRMYFHQGTVTDYGS
jgi:hypothetical protein